MRDKRKEDAKRVMRGMKKWEWRGLEDGLREMGLIVEEGTYIDICTECCKTISNITEGAGRGGEGGAGRGGEGGAGRGGEGGAGGGEEEVLTEGVEKMELVNESMYIIDNCTEYHKTI